MTDFVISNALDTWAAGTSVSAYAPNTVPDAALPYQGSAVATASAWRRCWPIRG